MIKFYNVKDSVKDDNKLQESQIKEIEVNDEEDLKPLTAVEINNTQTNGKIEKDDKQSFEDFKNMYKGVIDLKCNQEYGSNEDKDLWEDMAKQLYLNSKEYILQGDEHKPKQLEKKEESNKLQEEEITPANIKEKALEILPKEDVEVKDSDLYIKVSDKSKELINKLQFKNNGLLTTFRSPIDNEMWYDIPFANLEDYITSKTESNNNTYNYKSGDVVDILDSYGKWLNSSDRIKYVIDRPATKEEIEGIWDIDTPCYIVKTLGMTDDNKFLNGTSKEPITRLRHTIYKSKEHKINESFDLDLIEKNIKGKRLSDAARYLGALVNGDRNSFEIQGSELVSKLDSKDKVMCAVEGNDIIKSIVKDFTHLTDKTESKQVESRDRVAENLSKFIYDLTTDKDTETYGETAWSGNQPTKMGNGITVYEVYKNGKSNYTMDDIKKAVIERFPELNVYATAYNSILFYKPQKTESKLQEDTVKFTLNTNLNESNIDKYNTIPEIKNRLREINKQLAYIRRRDSVSLSIGTEQEQEELRSEKAKLNGRLRKLRNNAVDMDKMTPEQQKEFKQRLKDLDLLDDDESNLQSAIQSYRNHYIQEFESYTKKEENNTNLEYNYMLLDRLKQDCEYFLGNGNGNAEHSLWAKDIDEQIAKMKELYNSFTDEEKPEWITMEDINNYEKEMKEYNKEKKTEDVSDLQTIQDIEEYINNIKDEHTKSILHHILEDEKSKENPSIGYLTMAIRKVLDIEQERNKEKKTESMPDDWYNVMYDKYVPNTGEANTIGGEILRTFSGISRMFYQNGDKIWRGNMRNNSQVLDPLADKLDDLLPQEGKDLMSKMANSTTDNAYEKRLNVLEDYVYNYLKDNDNLFGNDKDKKEETVISNYTLNEIKKVIDSNGNDFTIKIVNSDEDIQTKTLNIDREDLISIFNVLGGNKDSITESRPDKDRARAAAFAGSRRRLQLPSNGLNEEAEIIEYLKKCKNQIDIMNVNDAIKNTELRNKLLTTGFDFAKGVNIVDDHIDEFKNIMIKATQDYFQTIKTESKEDYQDKCCMCGTLNLNGCYSVLDEEGNVGSVCVDCGKKYSLPEIKKKINSDMKSEYMHILKDVIGQGKLTETDSYKDPELMKRYNITKIYNSESEVPYEIAKYKFGTERYVSLEHYNKLLDYCKNLIDLDVIDQHCANSIWDTSFESEAVTLTNSFYLNEIAKEYKIETRIILQLELEHTELFLKEHSFLGGNLIYFYKPSFIEVRIKAGSESSFMIDDKLRSYKKFNLDQLNDMKSFIISENKRIASNVDPSDNHNRASEEHSEAITYNTLQEDQYENERRRGKPSIKKIAEDEYYDNQDWYIQHIKDYVDEDDFIEKEIAEIAEEYNLKENTARSVCKEIYKLAKDVLTESRPDKQAARDKMFRDSKMKLKLPNKFKDINEIVSYLENCEDKTDVMNVNVAVGGFNRQLHNDMLDFANKFIKENGYLDTYIDKDGNEQEGKFEEFKQAMIDFVKNYKIEEESIIEEAVTDPENPDNKDTIGITVVYEKAVTFYYVRNPKKIKGDKIFKVTDTVYVPRDKARDYLDGKISYKEMESIIYNIIDRSCRKWNKEHKDYLHKDYEPFRIITFDVFEWDFE